MHRGTGLLVEGGVIQIAFRDSQCGEETVVQDEAGRWMVSHRGGHCCPCKEVCIFKIPLKGQMKWLNFHCDSFEKKSQD